MSATKFYTAWFCPFAQRAWIALLEKGVNFEYVETDPYNKSKEWLEASPRGLVPALAHDGASVYESQILVEYIDEVWQTAPRLLPSTPLQRATCRIWCDHISKRVTPPFYQLLMKPETAVDSALALTRAIDELVEAMDPKGPFFLDDSPSIVDLMFYPFAHRLDVILGHYRGYQYKGRNNNSNRFASWLKAMNARPAVQATNAPNEKLVQMYERYANDTAKTEVADAIRQGNVLP